MTSAEASEDQLTKTENETELKSQEEAEDEQETEEEDYESGSDDSLDAQLSGGDPLKCRMYENDYPKTGDHVIVEVKKIVDMGAYCNLLEYNNLEGMLLMSELQRRRIRSVKKVIKEGRQEIVQVIRSDRAKHFIDLSKKRVDQDLVPGTEDRWNKSKASHSIMRQVSVLSKKKYSMKELYKLFGWQCAKDYGHLYDGFKFAMNNWDEFLLKYPNIPIEVQGFLKKNIEKRLKPQIVTVRSKVELTCFTHEGVDAIKRALKIGLKYGEEENNKISSSSDGGGGEDLSIKIKLVAPPLFTVSVSTYEPNKGIKLVDDVVKEINKSITESKGTMTIKQSAQVIANEDS
mmetsp:Transcript_57214/g.51513  ORF Transcript_57214/g.51513 Transcript_57214/m.51513 type:complete len:346 (-) Transcript_57214:49-1086(-)